MSAIPDSSVLLVFVTSVIVLNFTPGPDMTYFLGRTMSQGKLAGFFALLGTSSGILVHTLLVAFGLSALFAASPMLFLALKICGAVYLAWLAVEAIRHGSAFHFSKKDVQRRSLFANWWQGAAINLLNPKIILFFMTFLPQFISTKDPNVTGKLLFLGCLFALIGQMTMLPLLFVAARFSRVMKTSPRLVRVIDWFFATVLGAFAVRILFSERG